MIYKCYCKYVKDLPTLFETMKGSGERVISVTPFGTSQTAVTIITEKNERDDE